MTSRLNKTACVAAIASALLWAPGAAMAQSPSGAAGAPNAAPATNPSQPQGASPQATPSNPGPGATSSSGTVGRSGLKQPGRDVQLDDPKQDPVVKESEQEVSRRIKSICKGC